MINQTQRYETGTARPCLDAPTTLAEVMRVRLDDGVFSKHERRPNQYLALQFVALKAAVIWLQ